MRQRFQRPGLPNPARDAVEAGDDTELDFRQAEPRNFLAVANAIVTGERKFETASKADAVDRYNDRDRHAFDAVKDFGYGAHRCNYVGLGLEGVEFLDIRAGDKAFFLAGHHHQAAHGVGANPVGGSCQDRVEFLDGCAAKRILRLPFYIEGRPGDLLNVDTELPIFQVRDIGCHDHSSRYVLNDRRGGGHEKCPPGARYSAARTSASGCCDASWSSMSIRDGFPAV